MFDPMKISNFFWSVLLLVLISIPQISNAQVFTDTLSVEESEMLQKHLDKELKRAQRKYTFQLLPIIYYTPETRMAFGAGGILRFKFDLKDSLLPVSRVTPTFVYTLNEQVLAQVGFDLHVNRKWRVFGDMGYFVYPYFFAGVGNNHNGESLEWYDATYPKLNLNVYRHVISDSISVGLRYDLQNSKITPVDGGELELGEYPGVNGSVQSSIGFGFLYDSRDYQLSATKGWFADLSVMWADEWSGSSYNDQFIKLDIRKYLPIFSNKDVVALQFYSELHNGNVPFNLMSLLGGSERMRGYREGVFRDRQMLIYQVEYRSRLFFKYFGLAAFANLGGIGSNLEDVNANYRYTLGGGIRIAPVPTERYFIRLDYGVGHDTQGFYIAVGEAF